MFFKSLKNKLFWLLMTLFIIPYQVLAYSDYIIASGNNIGIEIQTTGVIVVGTYMVGNDNPAIEAGIKVGDKITEVNGKEVYSIDEMLKLLSEHLGENLEITYQRGTKEFDTTLPIIKDQNDVYKTGLYVKDSVTGVGTLTFVDPNTGLYGALGHEIIEKTTGQRLEIKGGKIYESMVTGINPSSDGEPGEKKVTYDNTEVFGDVLENTNVGIFGYYSEVDELDEDSLYKVGISSEIVVGPAEILTVVDGQDVEKFSIEILKVNYSDNVRKNILFEITDDELLQKTGGIIQGMSGSPIIQNDMIVGAVTHVVVDDCRKGYGVFITTMLEEAEN